MKKLLISLILAIVLQQLPQVACPQEIEGEVFVDPNQHEIDSLLNATHPEELATTTNYDSLRLEIARNYKKLLLLATMTPV